VLARPVRFHSGPVGIVATEPCSSNYSISDISLMNPILQTTETPPTPVNRETHVRVLREFAELEEIREAWESWPGNRDSEIESYLFFTRSNPGTVRPHVLVVYRGGVPDAILVGRIDRGKLTCRLGYLRISPRAQTLCFVYGALRGNASRENCDLMLTEVLRSLSQREADVAYMNFQREGTDLRALALEKPGVLTRDHVPLTQSHFAATLPSTVEDFYKSLSSKVRKNQRWQAKKLLSHFSGAVRIHCYREVADLGKMIQEVEQVAKKSYQRGLGVGFRDTPETREGLRLKAEKGWLRGYVLYFGDRPSAFWLGDVNEGTFGSDCIGYDAEFASHSPGMYLVMKVIEGFCDGNRDGVTGIDFGPGKAQYKEVLSNQTWRETSMYIFAPSLKGVSLNVVRSTIEGLDQGIKKVLAQTNLLQKIKKRWRNHIRLKEVAQSSD
jgi:hypothetical protein